MESKKLLSIVVPIFNEQENIPLLYQALTSTCSKLIHFPTFEVIMVNDGSRDNSLSLIKELAKQDTRIKAVSFTRNFGHEAATTAGLFHAHGDAVIIIDADLQDPPSLFFDFEREFQNGYDIVYGQRTKRLNEPFLKKCTAKLFYPLFRKLTKVDVPLDTGDFCLLSRRAINHFKQLPERTLFVRGMIYWSGLPKKAIPFVRQKRASGKTKYNHWKLARFALDNIISFSKTPLYLLTFISLFNTIVTVLITMILALLHTINIITFTNTMLILAALFFLFSATLFFIGFVGLYVGTICEEIKQRPRYLVNELINFNNNQE